MKISKIFVLLCGVFMFTLDTLAESLYNEQTFVPLYSDQKAWRVGDNITLIIVENASATTSADNSSDRGMGLSAGLQIGGIDEQASATTDNNSANGGSTQRKAQVAAQVTASIKEIDSQGRMFVKADQQILINDEKQKIYLEGWLRPKDISSNNIALSTRLSDAKIEYDGYGDVSKSTKPGIIQRFFQVFGLF